MLQSCSSWWLDCTNVCCPWEAWMCWFQLLTRQTASTFVSLNRTGLVFLRLISTFCAQVFLFSLVWVVFFFFGLILLGLCLPLFTLFVLEVGTFAWACLSCLMAVAKLSLLSLWAMEREQLLQMNKESFRLEETTSRGLWYPLWIIKPLEESWRAFCISAFMLISSDLSMWSHM